MPPVAVPDSEIVTDPLLAVAIVSVALCAPPLDGWNTTVAVVEPLGSSVVVPGSPALKLAGFAPPSVNGVVSVTLLVELRLVIVTLTGSVPPTTTEPKPTLVGETEMPGVGALFRFSGSLFVSSWKSFELSFVSTPLPLTPPGLRW